MDEGVSGRVGRASPSGRGLGTVGHSGPWAPELGRELLP